ncbi:MULTISPECIES: hypothetical protein [Mesorhizobium]|uniref:Uncharacterized protein n=1 Tax=Mesorhizobium qingshengii TaxID=1165689 RepID=A0A1G5ZWV4_9HYPH|nr:MULTISPECIES: hypothetical protein [Mesorhizobium]MCH4561005.1 hypothetical protein [Mesorhizobium jarvisii]SDA99264.1 hypothetical protein SAMN02927914_06514 [Mesorhizobium qingshengii]
MNRIDRSVVFARTSDGLATSHFSHRLVIDGAAADVRSCSIDPRDCDGPARTAWARWQSRVPVSRSRAVTAECGIVREGRQTRTYTVVHLDGAILEIDEIDFDHPKTTDELEWSQRPQHAAMVLGPSAVLALVDFAIDGVLAPRGPAGAGALAPLSIIDTSTSPYPPQHREDGMTRPLCTANSGVADDATFLLLQRSERWQRPLNALYNVNRRNLALYHPATVDNPPVALVIDTLVAEGEPTTAASNWIGRWHLRSPTGGGWGSGPLSIRWDVSQLLEATLGAVSPPLPACVRDPIEGDIFGLAPSLLVGRLPQGSKLDKVPG